MCVPKERGGMGFRDIHSFNLALLAKQCWRLIDNFDSLCARFLRSKYNPSGDLLNCEFKKGSSFTWKSIWAGFQTFMKGCIWRVGDGMKIYGMIVGSRIALPVVTVRGNRVLTKVNELINPVTGAVG